MKRLSPEAEESTTVIPRLEQVQRNLQEEYQMLSAAVAALTDSLRPFRNLQKLEAENSPEKECDGNICESLHFNDHTDSAVIRHMIGVSRDLENLRYRVESVHASIVV